MRKLRKAGISEMPYINLNAEDTLIPLHDRINKILGIVNNFKSNLMIYFIMYDIENNKVRTHISKYLLRKGCARVQKSIFLANTSREVYLEISSTIKEVQDLYDNQDSIFFVPVSTDEIKSMKVIGQNVDFDLIMKNKNTLFF